MQSCQKLTRTHSAGSVHATGHIQATNTHGATVASGRQRPVHTARIHLAIELNVAVTNTRLLRASRTLCVCVSRPCSCGLECASKLLGANCQVGVPCTFVFWDAHGGGMNKLCAVVRTRGSGVPC